MEKYLVLLNDVAELLAKNATHGAAVMIDFERIKQTLNEIEKKIETANNAG